MIKYRNKFFKDLKYAKYRSEIFKKKIYINLLENYT